MAALAGCIGEAELTRIARLIEEYVAATRRWMEAD
jgi:hypothetical protein